ncbi:MAG TPA: hypothetical protein VIX80_10870 [Candidatus Kapabacteria bacterium]
MALTRKTRATAPETQSLGDLLSALTQEFSRAALAADITRKQTQKIYDNNELLQGDEASKVRVVSARIEIPLAIAEIREGKAAEPGLSKAQVADMLHPSINFEIRERIAARVIEGLSSRGKNSIKNKTLLKDIQLEIEQEKIEGFKMREHFITKRFEVIKRTEEKNPPVIKESRFIYKAEDLRELGPEKLIKIHVDLDIS